MLKNFLFFFLGLFLSSTLHVSGVVDASRWRHIINREEVSDIADRVSDAVKEKFKK